MNDSTTDLDVIRTQPQHFTWGKVQKIHDIGRYSIAEYDERKPNSRNLTGKIRFHVYVDGESQCTSTSTLDSALLLAISIARTGPNDGRAAAAFMARALGIKETHE